MSTKLGLCTKCKTDDVSNRIFVVNSEASVCYCPHCMKQMQPKEAIDNYELYLDSLVSGAKKVLFGVKDYSKAYVEFAEILEFDPNCIKARYGRLLSLLYMSTVRKDRFLDFIMVLNNDYENYFSATEDKRSFLIFLNASSIALDEYEYFIFKKLTNRSYFYDLDCLKLFFLGSFHMLETRKLLLKYYEETLNEIKEVPDDLERYHQDIIYDVKKSEDTLAKHFYVSEGYAYSFAGFNENNKVMAGRREEDAKQINVKLRKATLDTEAKHVKVIKDKIYPDNIRIYKGTKVTLPLFIVFLIVSAICFGLGFYFTQKGLRGSLIISGIAFAIASAILTVIHIVFSLKLKSYRHLIN